VSLCWYYVALFPLLGVLLAIAIVPPRPAANSLSTGVLTSLASWDGRWYERIVVEGYSYHPMEPSTIAFFPGFPALAWAVSRGTGLGAIASLLVISHVSFVLLLLSIPAYLRDERHSSNWSDHVRLALLVWPMAVFFRFAYTESLFVLMTVLVLLGNRRTWPLPGVALLAGAATGVRSVGIVPAALVVFRCLREPGPLGTRLVRAAVYGMLSVWGLLAFMAFQQATFGDMFAFCRIQGRWGVPVELPAWRRVLGLIVLEPAWSVYVPGSGRSWAEREWVPNVLVGLQFWNPLYFAGSLGLLGLGIRRRWLTGDEVLLGLGLLVVPYVLQSERLAMMGQGRFSGAVFPCYLVMGRLLMSVPPPVRAITCGLSASVTTLCALLFAAGYRVF